MRQTSRSGCDKVDENLDRREVSRSKPFDATPKEFFGRDPRGWLEFLLSRKVGEVKAVNADLSTITSQADQLVLVKERKPWMAHVEFHAGHSKTALSQKSCS
jgi:hypothetical protein